MLNIKWGASAILATAAIGSAWADPATPPPNCAGSTSPYANYACLDTYLGDDVLTRLFRYENLELGQSVPPMDPTAPSSHRDGWLATPESTPPIPFTEFPYGGTTSIGVTRTGSVDSPLMVAISNTGIGSWMVENGFQIYGWVDAGFNISTNSTKPGGNAPISYAYTPNTVQLDQFVLYFDRFPDTVQTDHVDWGMRLSAIYGENYRYTFSYAPFTTDQLLKHNNVNGYDFPMVYGEIYVPQVADGLMLRLGRFISVPDIEAQLAPNNYMYSHSFSYAFDNYTNEGLQASLAVTPQLMLQAGVNVGTEAWIGHLNDRVHNPDPNPLYPGSTFKKDPGARAVQRS